MFRVAHRLGLMFICLLILVSCVRVGTSGKFTEPLPDPNQPPGTPVAIDPATGKIISTDNLIVLDAPPQRPLYVLNVTLDYDKGEIHAQQRIEFLNPSRTYLDSIQFSVPPAHRAGALEFNDARIFGAKQPLSYTLQGTILTVQLPGSLAPDKGIAMAFDFTVKVPLQEIVSGIGGDDTSRGPLSLTAGHWYVVLPPYKENGWDLPNYVPVGDPYTSELADFEVNILAPQDVIIAGGGDESRDGRLWRYSLKKARLFAFAASPDFKVDQVEAGGITYIHYAYPQHQKVNEAVLYTAQRAVQLFSDLYGPYPYKSLRIVETGRLQGQEYSGMIGIGTILYGGYPGRGGKHDLIATVVHETSHQWWFNVVGNDQVRTPWLDESFARMAELKFYRKFYTQLDVDWWYNTFIENKRPPQGAIDLSIYDYPDTKAYVDAIYKRGFLFLNNLRKAIGDGAFDAAMRDYYQKESYRVTTQDAFFDAIAAHSSEDISPLVKDYFANPVRLPCKISNNEVGCRR